MKTANKILLIAFGLVLISIVSLMLIIRKELSKELTKGSGRVVTETRDALPFMNVEIIGSLKVYLQQGDSLTIKIEADDNLLELVDTSIKNNKLRIGLKEPISQENQITAYITVKDLSRLSATNNSVVTANEVINGSYLELEIKNGAQSMLELNYEKVNLVLNSGATAKLHGKAEKFYAESSTGSLLDARFFEVSECDITSRTGSQAKVYVTDYLKATARSGSIIYFRGAPSRIERFTSGGGSIKEEK